MNHALQIAATPAHSGSPVDLLIAFFIVGLVPVLAVSTTSFTRIVVILSLLRTSLGPQSLPPNIVIVALALMLTGAVMAPTFAEIRVQALEPYAAARISPAQALARGAEPLRRFMLRQARPTDIAAFARTARARLSSPAQAPISVLAPAFLVGELRAAFAMGFALALPFVVIDIVVAAVLMSLGMFMVSPGALSLPLKLLLFVVADGWTLVSGALVASYR